MTSAAIASTHTDLAAWIIDRCRSDDYARRVNALTSLGTLITPATEVALIGDLIEHLRPKLAIEIGTFFGATAKIMAESVAKHGGKLITVDPVGGSRVPAIIEQWPDAEKAVTEFRPVYSMELFDKIESLWSWETESVGIAFVDGNHKFEYALFDIMESADNITPGGAIIIDNMEQQGPRLAVLQFLRMNPAWKLYYRDEIWTGAASVQEFKPPGTAVVWGVLIAPAGVQVTATGRCFRGRLRSYAPFAALTMNVSKASGPIKVDLHITYMGFPFDYHLTSTGALAWQREMSVTVGPAAEAMRIEFDPPASLAVDRPDINFQYRIDVTAADEGEYVLLDAEQPFELNF